MIIMEFRLCFLKIPRRFVIITIVNLLLIFLDKHQGYNTELVIGVRYMRNRNSHISFAQDEFHVCYFYVL